MQQSGVTKLLGLDYEVQYKKGAENKVSDVLSRQYEGVSLSEANIMSNLQEENHLHEEGQFHDIRATVPLWAQGVETSYEGDPMSVELITQLKVILIVHICGNSTKEYCEGRGRFMWALMDLFVIN